MNPVRRLSISNGVNRRFFYIFLLICLAGVLILPQNCHSSEYELSEFQAHNILNSCQQKLIDEWINITSSADFSEPEKQAALFLIRNGIQKKELSYWLEEVPKEYLKTLVKISAFLLVHPDISAVLDKIEKETVKQAVKIAKEWLLQNEIKIANGPLKYAYVSYKGNNQEPNFHYIISYHYLNNNKSKVIIEFYSPERVEPQKATASMLWVGRSSWELEDWLKKGNEKLEPFIIRVKGEVDEVHGGYSWGESSTVEVTFSEPVPEYPFEPEPSSFWQKIKKAVENEISGVVKDFQDIFDVFTEIKEKIPYPTDFGAQVSQPLSSTTALEEELKETKQVISSIEEEKKELENPAEDGSLTDLDELQEKIDDIAEMIDVLRGRLAKIIEERAQYELEKEPEEEAKENDKEDEEETEEEEKLEETEDETEEGPEQEIPVVLCQREQNSSPLRNKIIFNEITWMGTANSANDEWLELKNISEQEVNLSGWQILDKDEQIRIAFQQEGAISKIPSNGFYLLERTDDDSVPDIIADFIYTGYLNNTDEALYLFDQNCQLQDEIIANPNWPAGDKNSKRTMERKINLGWQTSADINGTPKAKNSGGYSESSGSGGSGAGAPPAAQTPTLCSQENLSSPVYLPVIINEISWMGTSSKNWRNEWIELKNISKTNVSLDGWQILDKDEQIKIIFDNTDSIPANNFYLLEWKNDDTIPNIQADKTYSGNLKDNDESLRLFDENCNLIDEALASPDWTAGDKTERRSMERNPDLSWHTYSGSKENGIMGTPKEKNSAESKALPAQPILEIIPESLEFTAVEFGLNPESQTLTINNIGEGMLQWTAAVEYTSPPLEGVAWLALDSESGADSSQISVSTDISDLAPGNYTAVITITASNVQNSPQEVPVSLSLASSSEVFSPATYVVISEVQISDDEFVELYNPTENDINISDWYFSYFSSGRDWNNPWRNKKFPEEAVILAKDYYLIGLKGYSESDWQVYDSSQLSDTAGAVAIFSCNPKYDEEENPISIEEAITCKLDALGWGDNEEILVKEEETTTPSPEGKSLARKIRISQEGYLHYIDNDNNKIDFEIQTPTPKTANQHPYSDLDKDGIIDSYDPETIIINSVSLEPGEHSFKDLTIENNAELVLNSNPSFEGFKGVKINAQNLFLKTGSSISADGKGYPVGKGYGEGKIKITGGGSCSGYNRITYGSGGGYGGTGGRGGYPGCDGEIIEGGFFYGSLEKPMDLGSSGGNQGGAGGGAIIIKVSEKLALDGQLSANGENGSAHHYSNSGGGSGGSIYIITHILEGSGFITVNGGQGNYSSCGGGGAGGRIAVYYDLKDNFNGKIEAFGETGFQAGGAGTIFLKSPLQEYGDLIIDNNNSEGITQLEENNYSFDNLEVLNSAHFYLPENLSINNIEINNSAILESFVTATIDGVQFVMTNESSLIGPDQIFLTVNANILSIQSASKIAANVNIDSENLFLDSTSSIIANGKGYQGGEGPGAGKEARTKGGSCSGYSYISYGSGGGYGGIGGKGAYIGCDGEIIEGGFFYGSLEEPMDLGSGGGAGGGSGGGAVRINITNNSTLNGLISANGEDGQSKAGGGSGGTVYIQTNILTGSGSVTANGGQGYPNYGGGGAGGRIAIYCQSSDFSGIIQAQGGTGYQNGESGSIFK